MSIYLHSRSYKTLFFALLSSLIFLFPSIQANSQTEPHLMAFEFGNFSGVFYAGIDNHFSIVVQPGKPISLEDISLSGGTLNQSSRAGWFVAHIKSPGDVRMTIRTELGTTFRNIRVMPIVPAPTFGGRYAEDSALEAKEFSAQGGIVAIINCCGFDAKCDMVSYSVTRINAEGMASIVKNKGARFEPKAMALIQSAKSGDTFIFSNILARCPGDKEPIPLHSLVFEIK